LDYCGPRWGVETEKAVEEFVKAGGGMVVVHGAIYGFSGLEVMGDHHARTGILESPWLEFKRMVGGYWPAIPSKSFHGERHSFQVKIKQSQHPILVGMDSEFSATDELYHELRFLRETQVLAEAYDDPALGGTGKKEPILCTNQYGKGRVFFTALGHEVAAMSEPGFITTFVRGTEWAATGKVSLPVFPALSPTSVDAIRLLVVTGGHDHDPSFYGLFEDEEGWNTTVVDTSQTAFRADLNSRFDVLVLYDLTQEINEIEKGNLRNFLENRNGLVVLHHALADYSDWDWWTREVIGGGISA